MSRAAKLARLFLAAALLAGWQAALEHPLRHVDEHGGFVHGSHDSGGTTELACDAIAAVAAILGNHDAPTIAVAAATFAVPAFRGGRALGAARLAYQSHAPPHYS